MINALAATNGSGKQTALLDAPPSNRPTHHQGVKIVSDERAENLPGVPFKYRNIVLADGRKVYGCVFCPDFIVEKRVEVRTHRAQMHWRDEVTSAPLKQAPPPAPAPPADQETSSNSPYRKRRESKNSLPEHVASMTLAEVLDMGVRLGKLGDHLERIEAERDAWRERAQKAESLHNRITKALEKVGFTLNLEDDDRD